MSSKICQNACFDLGLGVGGDLGEQIPTAMDHPALAQAVGEGDLDGADQPGRAVGEHQQR
jgi:hypothetical protein